MILISNEDIIKWYVANNLRAVKADIVGHSDDHDHNGQDEEEGSVNLVHFTLISLGGIE